MAKKFTRKGRKTRSAGRFGVRYGMKSRKLVANIEARMRQGYKCPKCGVIAIYRTDSGIWNCRKCDHTFSGGTYVPHTSVGLVSVRSVKKAVTASVFDKKVGLIPKTVEFDAEDIVLYDATDTADQPEKEFVQES